MLRRFLRAGKRKLSTRGKDDESRGGNTEGSANNNGGGGGGGGGRRRRGRKSMDVEMRGKSRLSLDENVGDGRGGGDGNGMSVRIGEEDSGRGVSDTNRGMGIGSVGGEKSVGAGGGGLRKVASARGTDGVDATPTKIVRRPSSRKDGSGAGSTPGSASPRKGKMVRKLSANNAGGVMQSAGSAGQLRSTGQARLVRLGSAGAVAIEEPVVTRIRSSNSSGRASAKSGESSLRTSPPPLKKRSLSGKKSSVKGNRRLSLDEAAVRGRRDSHTRRTSRGISAEMESEAVRGMDVDPSQGLQKGMPLGEVSEAEKFRRLSLDGDLPKEARRPDATPGKPEGEGVARLGAGGQGGSGAGVQFGACSKAGWEPHRTGRNGMTSVEVRKENQDAYFVYAPFQQQREVLLGVFDGHGSNGRTVAQFVRDILPEAMKEEQLKLGQYESQLHSVVQNGSADPARTPNVETNRMRIRALKAAFSRAERGLQGGEAAPCDHVFSGTTAVVSWIVDGVHIYTAWAGDSRCILGRKTTVTTRSANHGSDSMTRTKFKAVDLSHDQKPMRSDEKKRVRQAGGRVARWRRNIGPLRVWLPKDWVPGLAMTRSIGDTVLSDFGVSPIPEVTYAKLTPLDSFVVLASDGVWEFMNSDEVADFIGRWRKEDKDPTDAAEALVREAVRRWRRQEVVVDDTTAVVVWLDGESSRVGKSGYNPDGPPSLRGELKRKMEDSGAYSAKKKIWPFGRDKRDDKDKVVLIRDDGRFSPFNCRNDILVAQ